MPEEPARAGVTGSPPRQLLPDALRALALAGVLLVNAAGYGVAPGGPLLGALPQDASGWLLGLQGLYAFAVQGKALPMLAFLFGMGLWLATRHGPRAAALTRARRRQWALLGLGLVHGLFIYFGDILTVYAVLGGWVLWHVHEPWGRLRPRLWRAVAWALGTVVVLTALSAWSTLRGHLGAADYAPGLGFASVDSIGAFLALNASHYVWLQGATLLVGLPVLRLCMLLGVAAARLRLLTHPRWRAGLRRWGARWAAPALLLNAAYAVAYLALRDRPQWQVLLEGASLLNGLPLSAVLVLALAWHAGQGRAHWPRLLSPLGQRTLSLYIGHSVLCVLLFSGIGLGLQPGLGGMLVFSLVLWAAAWAAARASGARRWPLEAWLARR